MSEVPRIAVMASGDLKSGGGGSTANRFIRDVLEERVQLEIGAVICNNPPGSVGVYDYIDEINADFGLRGDSRLEVATIGPSTHPDRPQERGQTLAESEAICRLLEERGIDYVSMLGWMRILTGEFIETWGWQPAYALEADHHDTNGLYHPNVRIMNNHPGILPYTADTHGPGTHQKAVDGFAAGDINRTAMTWHVVAEKIDDGPKIFEHPIDIDPRDTADTLGVKVQAAEKRLTSLVVQAHLKIRAEYLHPA